MGNLPCMGLILRFRSIPSPRGLNHAYNGLTAGMHVDMLNRDRSDTPATRHSPPV